MNIVITWHSDQFNVELASAEGREAFLSVKGARIVQGSKGPFVSWPATKNQSTGKYWQHVWGSDKFNATVLSKAQESMPKQEPRKAPARAGGGGGDADSDIPFAPAFKTLAQ